MIKSTVLTLGLFVVFMMLFLILEFDDLVLKSDLIISVLVFSLTATSCIMLVNTRKKLLIISIFLLILMYIFYLFNSLSLANLLGSLGFGMLVIIVLSYLPQFFKKGYIDKL
ncbi:hypothetical protein HY386_02705 [Candidatus Daviesbacteria bacterium]|nr:hypothetical protein [Candidatus Daviesbacteria bacterium]